MFVFLVLSSNDNDAPFLYMQSNEIEKINKAHIFISDPLRLEANDADVYP
jgi:hypothetical protein